MRGGNRNALLAAALAVTGLGLGSHGPAIISAPAVINESEQKRQRRAVAAGAIHPVYPRSKNPPPKRKLKPNRNHISRRVRRKHRRNG